MQIELDTLILSTNFHELNFIRHLNQLECLFIHDCTLKGSLEGLADSNVKMLSLANIRNLTDLNDITSMHNLIYLRLSLPKVEALCDFSKMNNLRLTGNGSYESIKTYRSIVVSTASRNVTVKANFHKHQSRRFRAFN